MAKIQASADLHKDLDELKEKIMEFEDNLQGNIKQSINSGMMEFRDKMAHAQKKLEDRVQDRPLQSLATAFGAGLMLGAVAGALIKKR